MSTPAGVDLASRYGRPRNPRRRRTIGWSAFIAVFLIGVVFLVWVAFGKSDTAPSSKDIAFDIVDSARVEVTFSVVPDSTRTINCAVQALNEQFAVVGFRDISIPPSRDPQAQAPVTRKLDLRTQQKAVSGGIDYCQYE